MKISDRGLKLPVLLFLLLALTSCGAVTQAFQAFTPTPPAPKMLIPKIVASYPHDAGAFTQGLLIHEGRLFESTGLNGQSSLREVDLMTGEVLRQVDLSEEYFAEGLALVDDRLIQLTWQNGVAFVYDLETFQQIDSYDYTGEGWGLCYDGADLYMSDGSSQLYVRDAQTFEITATIPVTWDGQPVSRLNELECVGDTVFANIWLTNLIVQIDKATGTVLNYIDATGLLSPEEEAALGSGATLNGIAYDEATGRYFITGKLYPTLWEITLLSTRF